MIIEARVRMRKVGTHVTRDVLAQDRAGLAVGNEYFLRLDGHTQCVWRLVAFL